MSLKDYAERELKLSGVKSPSRVMELVNAFRAAGHSEGSAGATLAILRSIGWERARTSEMQHDGPVQDVIDVFAKQVYEGGQARIAFELFLHVAAYKPLGAGGSTDLEDFVPSVDDAHDVTEYCDTKGSKQIVLQSTRKPGVFSNDSGKTWYNLDRPGWAYPPGCIPATMPRSA